MSYLKPELFAIETLTNMLVGSGKANYGVIDQLVQRDATSNIPVIHASSLKGAIKEFCSHKNMPDEIMKCIFGSAKKREDGTTDSDTQTGEFKFLDAHLIALPVRSDKASFVYITAKVVLDVLSGLLGTLNLNQALQTDIENFNSLITDQNSSQAIAFTPVLANTVIEETDFHATYSAANSGKFTEELKKILPPDTILVSDKLFNSLSNDLHLPVIARNYLENGESANLWYEQIIPRQSKFWFTLLYPQRCATEYANLITLLSQPPIQIGANATVGYGYTKISSLIK
jgi:CRISPR-associated protein Cmr4